MKKKLLCIIPAVAILLSNPVTAYAITEAEVEAVGKETAAAVIVSVGFNKGKTMGQVAVEKPENLEWYVKSYGGPDNLLRAAAKYLMEMAFAQAG